jgi:beta-glucosidase
MPMMMKTLAATTAAAFLLAAGTARSEKAVRGFDGRQVRPERIDAEAMHMMAAANVQGLAMAVIDEGQVAFVRSWGRRNVGENLPLQTDTIMYGASLTKFAFAYMVLQLVDEGRIDLDRSIAEYLPRPLPEYPFYAALQGDERWRKLTPRILLSHTSGLANFAFLEPDGKMRFHFDPGQRYAYSGEGIMLMQFVLETGLGLKVGDEMQRRVFDRFGMTRTSMTWRPEFRENLADGYKIDGTVEEHDERSKPRAAGSMDTTVADFAKFLAGFMRGEGLSPKSRAELLRPQVAITTPTQFPTFSEAVSSATPAVHLSAGLGVLTYDGPLGRGFFKGGHNDSTGNQAICVEKGRRCVLFLANDVRAESVFQRLTEATLGDPGMPWAWESYVPYDQAPAAPASAVVAASPAPSAALPQLGTSPNRDVIAAMTRDEKVSLVMGTGMNLPTLPPDMRPPTVIGEATAGVPGAAGTTFAIPRLGIPSIVVADGPAGVRIDPRRKDGARTYHATAFPIATLLASTWDTALLERVGEAMGNEAREYGVDVLLAPALNIHRNPLGGRNFEYYSEDPLVSGRMAAAMVKGVQSQGVGTSIKHYAANNHEWNRNTIDVKVGPRTLREIYLRGFEIAVREGKPWTVMSSYNKVNGTYTSESRSLLTGVLRDDWQFDGLVMTDWFGGSDPVAQMKAGNDLLMPGSARQQRALRAALEGGALDEKILDANIERILGLIVRTHTFKKEPHGDAPDLKAHAAVAREAAAEGMVLLRNQRTLPLRAGARIALLGNSGYRPFIGGTGSGDVNEAYAISLEKGLGDAGFAVDKNLAARYPPFIQDAEARRPQMPMPFLLPPPIAEMDVSAGDIARLARDTDVAIVSIGRNAGEFKDRKLEDDFMLAAGEKKMLGDVAKAFHAAGKQVVVVLNVGGVVETASWRDEADAILLAWQPGQEAGHAIADVLRGRVAPSGKLATTFPVRWEDVPSSAGFPGKTLLGPDPNMGGPMAGDRAAEITYDDETLVGYRHFATRGVATAYPFGFGLSYTEFRYSGLRLGAPEFQKDMTASVTVTNTGRAAGREVVQLYLSAPGKTMPKPALELKGFAKTRLLQPGGSETLTFAITSRDLASFDERSSSWQAEAGTYAVKIGASSADIRQTATFTKAQAETLARVTPLQPEAAR